MYDPFAVAKRAGLLSSVNSAENMLEKIVSLPHTKEDKSRKCIIILCSISTSYLHSVFLSSRVGLAAAFALWGNKMDLSIWPADADNSSLDVFAKILHAADENLLHDDTDELAEHCEMLKERGSGKIDIIVDNAGFELVTVSTFPPKKPQILYSFHTHEQK
jgi:hypothetical protein